MERFNRDWLRRFLSAKTQAVIEAVGRNLDGTDDEIETAVQAELLEVFRAAAE
ncbi:MAG: hypothetical protein K2X87_13350 [Gemmataceae bacterium]|nr:hypothetical protein [Gemmataceae bacterium]